MKPVFGRQLLTPSLHPWRGYEAHLPSLATYTTRRTSHRASSVLLPQISRRTPRVSQNLGTYRIFSTGLLSSTISPSWAARTAVNMSSSTPAIPTTMSGILIEQTGGVDVLQWREDLPVPELKEGEVLVKNEFIGVNYIDT